MSPITCTVRMDELKINQNQFGRQKLYAGDSIIPRSHSGDVYLRVYANINKSNSSMFLVDYSLFLICLQSSSLFATSWRQADV